MVSDPGARQSFSVSPAHLTMLVVGVVSVYFIVGFYGKSLDSLQRDWATRLRQRYGS